MATYSEVIFFGCVIWVAAAIFSTLSIFDIQTPKEIRWTIVAAALSYLTVSGGAAIESHGWVACFFLSAALFYAFSLAQCTEMLILRAWYAKHRDIAVESALARTLFGPHSPPKRKEPTSFRRFVRKMRGWLAFKVFLFAAFFVYYRAGTEVLLVWLQTIVCVIIAVRLLPRLPYVLQKAMFHG